jgi:hypothetical protein
MVRRHFAEQRPQQFVSGHELLEFQHQHFQHFGSTQPLIQQRNSIVFHGHFVHFPFFFAMKSIEHSEREVHQLHILTSEFACVEAPDPAPREVPILECGFLRLEELVTFG